MPSGFSRWERISFAIKNLLWQTCQPGDLNTVAFVRAARDHFAQENDLVIPLANCDIEIANAFAFRRELVNS